MARRDQQIDASNFVYSIDRKIAPFLKITASKRAPHGSEFANRRKKGVRIPPVRGKQWLASMESFVNFRAEKARKRLMPLAFRQWHLYRFDFMVPVTGLEPVRCRQRWILSYSSHSEPNGLNRNKTVFSVTFQNIKNPKKPYKISIFDAKHQKYKQFVPSSIIGSQIPNLRRWRDVGGM